ncbi:MAG: hypothetical protein K8823_1560 [Cenarchaeum symbiont of Oopsacas minuta]|nr:hypothetical protein [Cenarchaeum symbiont of Oopsacas minuta]
MSASTGFYKGQLAYLPQGQVKKLPLGKNQSVTGGMLVTTDSNGYVIAVPRVAAGPAVFNNGGMIINTGGSIGNTASDIAGQESVICQLGKGRIIVELAAGVRTGNSLQTVNNSNDKFTNAAADAPANTIVGHLIEIAGNAKIVSEDGDLGVMEVKS